MLKLLSVATLALTISPLAQACPTLEGEFGTDKTPDGSYSVIELYTRVLLSREANATPHYEYSLGAPNDFIAADGVERTRSSDGDTGTLKVSCADNWMEFEAKLNDGRQVRLRYTRLNENQVRVDGSGNIDGMPTGVFTRI